VVICRCCHLSLSIRQTGLHVLYPLVFNQIRVVESLPPSVHLSDKSNPGSLFSFHRRLPGMIPPLIHALIPFLLCMLSSPSSYTCSHPLAYTLSYTPRIHSLVHSSLTLLSYTLAYTLSYTPLIHSSRTLSHTLSRTLLSYTAMLRLMLTIRRLRTTHEKVS
jgi:hypothetical protein